MALPAPDFAIPRFLQKGRGETLDFPVYSGTSVVAPTSATFQLLDADRAVVVAEAAATITNGIATYVLTSTFADSSALPQFEWFEIWTLSGLAGAPSPMTFERQAQVHRVAPFSTVTPETLFRMHTAWRRLLPKSRADYHEPIREAWDELIQRLLGDQRYPGRVLNWHSMSVVHKYWSAHIVCRDFQTDNPADSAWGRLMDRYWERAEKEYEHHLALQVDANEDGIADHPGTVQQAEPELFLTAVPTGDRTGRGPWQ